VTADPAVRRLARAVLTRAVRGRSGRGSEWGEALLSELEATTGGWEALRWSSSGLRVVWRERRRGLGAETPPRVRVGRRAAVGTLALVAGVAVIRTFVAGVAYIPSESMGDTLRISDRVLVDKLTYRFRAPRYGEVVLASIPSAGPGEATPVILTKRVVGLPGDRIECRDGSLYRNDAPVEERYLSPGATTQCAATTVAPDHVYLIGDNRVVSRDSRHFGPVAESDLIGHVAARVWPPSHLGVPGA
jgi:signal peptidase I